MKKRTIFFIITSLFFSLYAQDKKAEDFTERLKKNFIGKNLLTFDLRYTGIDLNIQGFGVGGNFERQLYPRYSIKVGLDAAFMWPLNTNLMVNSFGIRFENYFYPFGNGLDKLYFGFGTGMEYLLYNDFNHINPHFDINTKDLALTFTTQAGWKQNIKNYCMIDFIIGYKFLLNEDYVNQNNLAYISKGVYYGAKIKLNIADMYRSLKRIFNKSPRLQFTQEDYIDLLIDEIEGTNGKVTPKSELEKASEKFIDNFSTYYKTNPFVPESENKKTEEQKTESSPDKEITQQNNADE